MNQNGGIHKGGFAVLCHRNGGSESPGILTGRFYTPIPEIGNHRSDMKETAIPF